MGAPGRALSADEFTIVQNIVRGVLDGAAELGDDAEVAANRRRCLRADARDAAKPPSAHDGAPVHLHDKCGCGKGVGWLPQS